MSNPLTILALGAHPDDLEFGCGGVLLKAKANGAIIHVVLTSCGESGSAGTPEQRKQEAQDAARRLGHLNGPDFLHFGGDGLQIASKENTLRIAEIIRRVQPSHVLAPSLAKNQHPDHSVVGEVARDACRLARFGGLDALSELPVHRVNVMAYYKVTSSEESQYGERIIVDVGEVFEEWQSLMKCHLSQISNRNYLELVNARARHLGLSIGAEFAQELYLNDSIVVEDFLDIQRTARSF